MAILFRWTKTPSPRKFRPLRWIVLLIASLLLHVLAFQWADGRIVFPSLKETQTTVITTALKTAEPTVQTKPLPPPPPPPKKPRSKPRRIPPAPQPGPVIESEPTAGMEVPGTSVEPVAEIAPIELPPDSVPYPPPYMEELAALNQPESYKVDPPPSAALHFDVRVLRQGQEAYGHGNINWETKDGGYTITGDAGALIFTFLSFRSEGTIDSSGVAPVIYSEKRFRRSETNTHFHRERNTISFSASTVSYARKGGEQDRASVVWQLASIGRGDSSRFAPGAEIDIVVAGVRDADTWHMQVKGIEEIELNSGKINAWHLVRMPRPGSYDQRLDIWLAPQHEWYPVKLLYTETNGDYLDMSLSNLNSFANR